MYFVGFEHIWIVIIKGKMVVLRHATSFSPSRTRNFMSYFIHDTLWAYPSVTQLKKTKHKKKSLLLTFSIHTLFGSRRLTNPSGPQTTPFPYTTQKTLRQLKRDIPRTGKRIKRFNDKYLAEGTLMHHVSVDCKLMFCTHTQQKPPPQKQNSQTLTSLLCLFSIYSLFFSLFESLRLLCCL